MKRSPLAFFVVVLVVAAVGPVRGQDSSAVYQSQKTSHFKLDVLTRQEWTQDIFVSATDFKDESRRLIRLRPRMEFGTDKFMVGVGAELNYGSDENTKPPAGASTLTLLRDNYKSRDARLDLAFANFKPTSWLRLQGGRFPMPVGLTEMIWDKDLRPQGGAASLEVGTQGGTRFSATLLGSRGGHVFTNADFAGADFTEETNLVVLSGELSLPMGQQQQGRFVLTGSYLKFTRLDLIVPFIRRQNTRVAGAIVNDYRVIDVVARVQGGGNAPVQLVADLSWNTAVDENKRGMWLAAVLGSLQETRARLEYVYAKVDKDATVAAFGADDFFWVTGWEGHRGDFGTRIDQRSSVHLIGQLQRFKDSPRVEEREHSGEAVPVRGSLLVLDAQLPVSFSRGQGPEHPLSFCEEEP